MNLDDTLTSIAVQYSTTVHQLKRTNKMFLTSNEVEPGKLSYPSCPSALSVRPIRWTLDSLIPSIQGRILKIPISNGERSITPTETPPRIPTPENKAPESTNEKRQKSRKNHPEQQPPTPQSSTDKMSDFFAKIDLGIKSSRTRLENANTSGILDRFENDDLKNDYGGYIKL